MEQRCLKGRSQFSLNTAHHVFFETRIATQMYKEQTWTNIYGLRQGKQNVVSETSVREVNMLHHMTLENYFYQVRDFQFLFRQII